MVFIKFAPPPFPKLPKYLSLVLNSFNFCGYVSVVGKPNHLSSVSSVANKNACGAWNLLKSKPGVIMSYPENNLLKSKTALTTTSPSRSSSTTLFINDLYCPKPKILFSLKNQPISLLELSSFGKLFKLGCVTLYDDDKLTGAINDVD